MKNPIVLFASRLLVTILLFTQMMAPTLPSTLTAFAKQPGGESGMRQEIISTFPDGNEVADLQDVSGNAPTVCFSSIGDTIGGYLRRFCREGVVSYMYVMATIKWTPSKSFSHWSGKCVFEKGKTYYGIPYSQKNRDNGLEEFEKKLKNGKYTGPTGTKTYIGNDCSSAVSQAYDFATGGKFGTRYTGTLVPGSKNIKKVGSYSYSGSTYKSTRSNGKNKMVKAYKKLQKGDLVVTTSNPHVMMVSGTKSGGITVIHQTTYSAKLRSTWRVNEYISFDSLYNGGYVPVTLSIF